jgi:hypothetical protein
VRAIVGREDDQRVLELAAETISGKKAGSRHSLYMSDTDRKP